MFSEIDLLQIKNKGTALETIHHQIKNFQSGFPFMEIVKAATIGDGILKLNDEEIEEFAETYDNAVKVRKVVKFVPASGAATRMFKSLFEFLNHSNAQSLKSKDDFIIAKLRDVYEFLEKLPQFAFYNQLKESALLAGYDLDQALEDKNYHKIIDTYLTASGLNYGNLPKGLIKFHKADGISRTPFEEHLVEAALYANMQGVSNLHFTVSSEHQSGFKALVEKTVPIYQTQFNCQYKIDFSEQKPSTDTIAVDMNNDPFRNSDGSLLFRPAGHGALLENLNNIDADIIFIKNIDNVVPGDKKELTVKYKKALAGVLISLQRKIFDYLRLLEQTEKIKLWDIEEIGKFIQENLNLIPTENFEPRTTKENIAYLIEKLNRPIRVCGMVKNEGEPGGGPFWSTNSDGTVSLQIVETSQIDTNDPEKLEILRLSTHFNPVDLICSPRKYDGKKFDLRKFSDPNTGFISKKSKDGKDLKAQELPGLWNGAMANWNTIFVEVPIQTFTPVKIVNDLLRSEHQ